jgi:hypothetical protein
MPRIRKELCGERVAREKTNKISAGKRILRIYCWIFEEGPSDNGETTVTGSII